MHRGLIAGMAIVITMCSSIAGKAQVCDCREIGPVAEEFARSDAVFTGRVFEIQVGVPLNRVRLERYDCWKGAPEAQVDVLTPRRTCGYRFQLGVQYLVYATLEEGALLTYGCTRTRVLVMADEDLAALGPPTCVVAVAPGTWAAVKQLYLGNSRH